MDFNEISTADLLRMLVDPVERREQWGRISGWGSRSYYEDARVLSDIIAGLASRIDGAHARISLLESVLEANGIPVSRP